MNIKKFDINTDLTKLETFLRDSYLKKQNMTCWLPQRLHDLIYRLSEQEKYKGSLLSKDYIYIYEENNKIVASILPDGDLIYFAIDSEHENIFEQMIIFAQNNLTNLFKTDNDGYTNFTIASNDSLKSRKAILEKLGYTMQLEKDYDNFVYPLEQSYEIRLTNGFSLKYGNEYANELNKWSACNLGFHPDLESPNYSVSMNAYNGRKLSSFYNDSFECIVVDENTKDKNNVCSYSFVYVDKISKTAFIEPVSTREKYRHMKIGTAMMHGIINKCKELGIEKCYVNSYDWRKKFYNAAGFSTEDTISFWYKRIQVK